MRPLAAFGFVCAGVAFWLVRNPGHRARLMVRINAVIIAILGIGTLVTAIFKWQRGFGLLADQSTRLAAAGMEPVRMASNTAAGFVLTAVALFLMSRPLKMARLSLALAVIGSLLFAFGLMVLTGYVANFAVGGRWWDVTGMAFPSSLLFVMIGLTILSVAWEQAGLRWIIGKGLAACFLCGLGLFAAVATNSYRSTQEILEATNLVRHTHAVVAAIQQLWADIKESQSTHRAYLITNDQQFLSSNLTAVVGIHTHFDEIRALTVDNRTQQSRLEALEELIVEWMEANRELLKPRGESERRAPLNPLDEGNNAARIQRIRAALDQIEKEEYGLLAVREQRSVMVVRKAFAILPIGTLLSLSFLGTGLFLLNREVTRRQSSTEALEKSEERLRSLVVASSQLVWISPPEGNTARPLLSHAAAHGELNEAERFIPGQFSAIHPDDLERVRAAWNQALDSATPYFAECRAREADGTYRDYAARAVPVFDSEGKLCEWVGACSDITERKQAEREIQLLNAEMEQIFRSAGDGIVRLDAKGHLLFLNPAAVAMFGWELDEIVGCSFHDKVHGHHADGTPYPRQECPVLASLADAQVHRGSDELYWKKDGTAIVLDFISTPLFEEKKVSGVVVLYHDTTERKKAEEALRASEASFRELADAMPQIVWAGRADGFLEYYNKRWFEYTGMMLEQTKGWGWDTVLHPDDLQNCIDRWAIACRTGELYEIEYRF
jgi:PAS domain S-box-containing protein